MTPQEPARARFAYSAFGLAFDSEVELPDLRPRAPGPAEVVIGLGEAPPRDDAMTEPLPGLRVGADRFVLDVPDCALIDVRDGRRMWVALAREEAARDARAYILGSAVGALLLQRGRLPLHASAVTLPAGAIGILVTHSLEAAATADRVLHLTAEGLHA